MTLVKEKPFVDHNFFQSSATFFKITGLWRLDNQPKWFDAVMFFNRFNVFFTFGWAFTASVLSGCYLHFITGDTEKALIWGTFSVTYIVMQHKFFMLATKETQIRNIIRQLENISSQFTDKSKIQKNLRTSEKLIVIGSLLVGGACIGYCIIPVILNYRNVLPIRTMFTFGTDVFRSPIYEIYIVYQLIGTVSHTVIAMAYDMTYVGFLLCTAGMLENLNMNFEKNILRTDQSPDELHWHLLRNLKSHIKIFEFLNEVREIFMVSNMLHFFYNYFTAGLTMFQISRQPVGSIKFFSMVSGCSSCLFALICYCEAGQKINDEMHIFWQNLYFTAWYEQPIKFRKKLIFASLASQKEYYIMAGKLMTLSRETEKKIIQAIFTYYTFLLQLNS